jgi:hypothetical protein
MKIYILSKERANAMGSKQIFMIAAIVVAFSSAMMATPVMAQNMTGGNMTGGNITGGNMTGGNITGGNITGGNMTGGNITGSISGYEEDAECSKSPACIS